MPEIVVGKRYNSGFVDVKVKEIRDDVMILDYNNNWSRLVICDTPTMTCDVGLPLNDLMDHFEEDA